jgi:hypothetical protein
MAKGIKKIKYSGGMIYPKMSVPNVRLTIAPDQWVWFDIEWEADTTPVEKRHSVTWLRQSSDRRDIIKSLSVSSTDRYGFKIIKKLCGSYHYFIEASTSGKPYINNSKGLYVKGYCTPKIVSSKWSTQNDGNDIRKAYTFSYGQVIYLNLATEGMNGDTVMVDIFRRVKGGDGADDDQYIHTYTSVKVIDGEVNLETGNTYAWYAKIGKPGSVEEFYVKVKAVSGKYISDGKDTIHARFLRIKNTIVSRKIETTNNNTPVVVGQIDKSPERIGFAVVYFRPLDSWNGEFGFDWLREKDNGLNQTDPTKPGYDPAYADIIEGGYKDGKEDPITKVITGSDLTGRPTGTAYAKLKTQYPIAPIAPGVFPAGGYAPTQYFVPYLTLFSKEFVDTLPSTLAEKLRPVFEAKLKVFVAIKDTIDRLEFEYNKNLLEVNENILKDKNKTNGLVASASVLKITCKKDLPSDKEIKIYAYPKNGQPRMLAGKIVVLKNDASVRKKEKFVLVSTWTDITKSTSIIKGQFTRQEIENFYHILHQALIMPTIEETSNVLDLSGNADFQTGGKYIDASNKLMLVDLTINDISKPLFHEMRNLFLNNPLNSKYKIGSYFTIFSSLMAPNHPSAIGCIEGIGIHNAIMLLGRRDTTLPHEAVHGLGLYHTHNDGIPIIETNRKYTFANGTTTNIVSYANIRNTSWRWQWHIINSNIPEK